MVSRILTFGLVLAILGSITASGQDVSLQPPEQAIADAVDFYLERSLGEINQEAGTTATDATLLRRTTLDLVGRIPTVREAQSYVSDTASDKRLKMVKRLLDSPGYLQHQVHELAQLLHPDDSKQLQNYLTHAVNNDASWDRIFRDLMLPPAKTTEAPEADRFIKSRIQDIDKLANDTSVLFFGVNISCAKCHDHPLVEQWKQSHFFGMTRPCYHANIGIRNIVLIVEEVTNDGVVFGHNSFNRRNDEFIFNRHL